MAEPKMREGLDRMVLAIAEALDLTPEAVVQAFQENRAEVRFGHDEDGRRTIGVRIAGRAARFAAEEMENPDPAASPRDPS